MNDDKSALQQKGLAWSFAAVTIIISLLWWVAWFSLNKSLGAVDLLWSENVTSKLVGKAVINLTESGQLPKEIETAVTELLPLHEKLNELQKGFTDIKEELLEASLSEKGEELAKEFLLIADQYYDSLAEFFPLKREMLNYTTEYGGEYRSLEEVLTERELGHIRYVRALRKSAEERRMLVGALDYKTCGFYKWYNENLIGNEEISEIILEEVHPLHKNFHDYAAQLDKLLRENKYDQLEDWLAKADADLERLGVYHAGIRALAHENEMEIRIEFKEKLKNLQKKYDSIVRSANQLENHMEKVDLQASLDNMRKTATKSKVLLFLFAFAGVVLSVVIAYVTFSRVKAKTKELHDLTISLAASKDEIEKQSTELKEAFNELKETQAQLLQKEKMASIGQLAAGVAHEINNPVGFISSNLGTLGKYFNRYDEFIAAQTDFVNSIERDSSKEEIVKLRKKLKLDFLIEDTKDLLEESIDGTRRISEIVQSLKNFSRVDQAEFQEADLSECLESTLSVVWNEVKYKAKVIKEYGDLPLVKCFPNKLNQVFMNLLVNGVHAIEKQGEITIKSWADKDNAFVSISDTGQGIPEENLNKLFEPFFTTKDVGKGTGLGLSIVYDIVKKDHKGDIEVESEVGIGTTFTVRIPLNNESNA